ncbi:MAG: nucleotidyltransferase family protein [Candidatus Cloacimonadota bacterium]|nr:nucleotidyltransferase family protein [Candidatus Cloacimonadota bacterium]
MAYRKLDNIIKKKIISILVNAGAKRIGIFGSFANGTANSTSDIDILVEFFKRKSLLELVSIERELSESIGRKIDLLTEKSISPYLIDKIKSEERIIYESDFAGSDLLSEPDI